MVFAQFVKSNMKKEAPIIPKGEILCKIPENDFIRLKENLNELVFWKKDPIDNLMIIKTSSMLAKTILLCQSSTIYPIP